ncbi:hypothetical protein B7463_g1379, partial [Scytalidium lignicola]
MRQVLELTSSLISTNPDKAAQPWAKPSFKALECFLNKGTISTSELAASYQEHIQSARSHTSPEQVTFERTWDSLISEVFDWIVLADVSPAAGKFLVSLFRGLRTATVEAGSDQNESTVLWQKWIRQGLSKYPDAVENIKNYLLPPLFKLDRPGSLEFLKDLNSNYPLLGLGSQELDAQALLQLSALEIGKKAGLVEEPIIIHQQKLSKKSTSTVVLQEDVVGSLLVHSSGIVRSLAFSVLVSSHSPLRPFSKRAINYLQESMGILFADPDAKVRDEILSTTRLMLERVRGASSFLLRDIESLSFSIDTNQKEVKDSPDEFNQNSSMKPHISKEMRSKMGEEQIELLSKHQDFIQWYLEFLSREMNPTTSYQRHITALRATRQIIRSGILDQGSSTIEEVSRNTTIWPYTIKYFTPLRVRLLLDLLMDPFEDVRVESAAILKFASCNDFFNVQSSKKKPLALLMDFITRAKNSFKKTGRADDADGLARAYEILYSFLDSTEARLSLFEEIVDDIETKVAIGERDLARGMQRGPIHGQFAALRLIWESIDYSKDSKGHRSQTEEETVEEWDSLALRAMYSCCQIWENVKKVLCDKSPEGHLPEELEELEKVGTKDVLSYSFRAIHESSNLMRALVSKIRLRWPDGSPVLSPEVFNGIGAVTFDQLSTLRHRGAFSTVSLTFATCCQLARYQVPGERSRPNILEKWYKGSMSCIFEQASTTRRSAGIPALITGILSASAQKPAFDEVMTELKCIARRQHRLTGKDETHLPQVHAMNCMKEIFKSSTLGKRADGYIAECLEIAAESLNSEIWAIRNCGLLLFRSLVDSLLGISERKSAIESGWDGRSIRISYDEYPSLPQLLLKLLKTGIASSETTILSTSTSAAESVFPALDIIRRAGPPDIYGEEIYNCVSTHLGSSVWHVREIAARTICTMLLHKDWQMSIVELLKTSGSSTNRLHGVLLAIKFTLERQLQLDHNTAIDGLDIVLPMLHSSALQGIISKSCDELLSAYIDVLNTVLIIRLVSNSRAPKPNIKPDSTTNQESSLLKEAYDQFFDFVTRYTGTLSENEKTKLTARSALLCTRVAHRATLSALLAKDNYEIAKILVQAAKVDVDVTLSVLETLPQFWEKELSTKSLADFSNIYITLIENSKSSEVLATSLIHLAQLLDRLNATPSENYPRLIEGLDKLGFILQHGGSNPTLYVAQIRISGLIMRHIYVSLRDSKQITQITRRFIIWGQMLRDVSDANNDFDTRYAAAASLRSFYTPLVFLSQELRPYLIPSLFALYDTLNDDDEEIRDFSAATVSSILKTPLVSLIARERLAEWMGENHGKESLFAWEVVCRMTGTENPVLEVDSQGLLPIRNQLEIAMRDDDALFVEEEQNLFIDEIRETELWTRVFQRSFHPRDAQMTALVTWVMEGLVELLSLEGLIDGPLGYTSDPSVFALIFRLLTCTNVVLEYLERSADSEADVLEDGTLKNIMGYLERFIHMAAKNLVHESLVYVVLGQPTTLTTSSRSSILTNTSLKYAQPTPYQRLKTRT